MATSVLRNSNCDYEAIVHLGINAQGKTIRSPVDGFCRIPGSEPAHYLFAQYTTTDKKSLRSKWLDETDGDLIKSHRLAESLRESMPDAKFKVLLVTNQNIDIDLSMEIDKESEELGLEYEIWEQSRLVDFLDNKPEGHWIRKECLSIEAERLSDSLLKHLCSRSLVRYERNFLSAPESWVSRELDDRIKNYLLNNKYMFQALLGESGFGKSVAAYKEFKNHLESGGRGIWVPAESILKCNSIESLLDEVLHDLYPSLLSDSGKEVPKFIPEGFKFLLVVDDINRTDRPKEILNKLLAWSRPFHSEDGSRNQFYSPYLVVCPLWPQIWDQYLGNNWWIDTVSVGPMNAKEGSCAVMKVVSQAGISITGAQAVSLTTKMGNDPILIGLFGQIISKDNDATKLKDRAENVVEVFIAKSIEEIVLERKSYLIDDYKTTLSNLGRWMLLNRKLLPTWEEINTWFKDDQEQIRALRDLIQSKILCQLTDESRLIFRHDRIREALLAKSMILLLGNHAQREEIFKEPYYAEIIGKAIILSTPSDEILDGLAEDNPLALFEAVKNLGAINNKNHKKIINLIFNLYENKLKKGIIPESNFNSICWSLLEADSPAILEITKDYPAVPPILLSRLRNGCALSGAIYCSFDDFEPGNNSDLRDRIIDHAKRLHCQILLKDLRLLLTSTQASDKIRKGALILTGFLGFDLEEEILACWNLAIEKDLILTAAIWAAARCCKTKAKDILNPMMKYWSNVSDEENSYGMTPRRDIAEKLLFGLSHGINDAVIHYFINLYDFCEPLCWPITIMFERIDSPEAIEFITRVTAKEQTFFAMSLPDRWDPSFPAGKKMSQASMDHLRILWESADSGDSLKNQAFRIWIRGAGVKELDIIRMITTDSKLYHLAIRRRALLGDRSVIPEIVSILSSETHMFDVAYNVWDNKIMAVAERDLCSPECLDFIYTCPQIIFFINHLIQSPSDSGTFPICTLPAALTRMRYLASVDTILYQGTHETELYYTNSRNC